MRLFLLASFLCLSSATDCSNGTDAEDKITIEWTNTPDGDAAQPIDEHLRKNRDVELTEAEKIRAEELERETELAAEKLLAEKLKLLGWETSMATVAETTTISHMGCPSDAECFTTQPTTTATEKPETTTTENKFDPPCSGPLNKGRDYIILLDRSGLSDKEKMVNLTEGFMDMINPWETNNRVALITYARKSKIDIDINSTASKEEMMEILRGIRLSGPGDMMLAMKTANEEILDNLPWREDSDKEKVVVMLMADDSSVGTTDTGAKCNQIEQDEADFRHCMQKGYAHQSALMTAKYKAQIFLVTVGRKFMTNLQYVAPSDDIVHIQDFPNFFNHYPLLEFARRFCLPVRKTIN